MRSRLLTMCVLPFVATVAIAQPYSYRCWFDSNVATAVSSSATGETTFEVDVSQLPPGLHAIHVEAWNGDGRSSIHTRYFLKDEVHQAAKGRYWLDDDLSSLHEDVAANGTIELDVSSLSEGLHAVHYQTFSADGMASAVHTRYFIYDDSHQAAKGRYWFDDDLSTLHDNVATSGTIDLDFSSLSEGLHAVHYQTFTADGMASAVHTRYFIYNGSHQAAKGRYWFDDDLSTLHDNLATSGTIDLDVSALSAGLHAVHYQTFSADGMASAVYTCYFLVGYQIDKSQLTSLIWIDDNKADAVTHQLTDEPILLSLEGLEGEHVLHVELYDVSGILIGEQTVSFVSDYVKPTPKLSIANLEVVGDGIAGTEHTIKALIKNEGADFTGSVYYYASLNPDDMGERQSALATDIASGEENHSFSWQFIPETAGTYYIWIGAVVDDMEQLLDSTTFLVKAPSPNIDFADAEVKRICVENWDTNGDGELSEEEAAVVESIGTVFKENKTITSFDEFQYFTSVTDLEAKAFEVCSNFSSIIFPNRLKNIGPQAFEQCVELKAVQWPDNDGFSVGAWAFDQCGFTSISIPDNLIGMNGNVFSACPNLTEILVDENNPNYQSVDGVVYSKDMKTIVAYPAGKEQTEYSILSDVEVIALSAFHGAEKLMNIDIPASVKTLRNYCFFNMYGLKSLIIPELVTEIPYACTANDNALEELYIPENTTSIAYGAFWGNNASKIVLPSKIRSIAEWAFYGSLKLEEVVSYIKEPFAIADNVFYNGIDPDYTFTSATLYVPVGTKEKYQQTDGWKNFQNIVEIDDGAGKMGDVNNDGYIDVADLSGVVRFILEDIDETLIFSAADMDGNGIVEINDYSALVNVILNQETNGVKARRSPATTERLVDLCHNGKGELLINLLANRNYTGMQFDLQLSDGITLDENGIETGSSQHGCWFTHRGDGRYRIICSSMNNAEFSETTVLRLPLQGDTTNGSIAIDNVILSDTKSARYGASPLQLYWGDETLMAGISDDELVIKSKDGAIMLMSGKDRTVRIVSLNGMVVADVQLKANHEEHIKLPDGIYLINSKKVVVHK